APVEGDSHRFGRPTILTSNRARSRANWPGLPPTISAVRGEGAAARQVVHDPPGDDLRGELGRIDDDVGRLRRLVDVADAREVSDLAAARAGVKPLRIAPLADGHGRGDMNEHEAAERLDHRTQVLAHVRIRSDGRADRDATALGDLRRDAGHATEVRLPIRP